MNCKEFKDLVVCLFDTQVDLTVKTECEKHIAKCPHCKTYYEELKETFEMLHPKHNIHTDLHELPHPDSPLQQDRMKKMTPSRKPLMHTMRKYAAAVAIFASGVAVGWTHFFSSDAVAGNTAPVRILSQAISYVQNVGSFEMNLSVRTLPNENFQYLNEKADFINVAVQLMRQGGQTLFRVEKDGGRTVVCDGENQYMWDSNSYIKGGKEANFLEHFGNFIYPEKLLAMQDASVNLSTKNKIEKTETDSTIIVVTESIEKDIDLQQLFEKGKMDDCKIIVQNVFSKNDGLLRDFKIYFENNTGRHLVVYCDEIQYNTLINKSTLAALPNTNAWQSAHLPITIEATRSTMLQNEKAQQAAQRIMNAIISGNESMAAEALYYYKNNFADLHKRFKDGTATNFVVKKDLSYAGVYVFYTLTTNKGKQQLYIALRNDNEQHIWLVDGGL